MIIFYLSPFEVALCDFWCVYLQMHMYAHSDFHLPCNDDQPATLSKPGSSEKPNPTGFRCWIFWAPFFSDLISTVFLLGEWSVSLCFSIVCVVCLGFHGGRSVVWLFANLEQLSVWFPSERSACKDEIYPLCFWNKQTVSEMDPIFLTPPLICFLLCSPLFCNCFWVSILFLFVCVVIQKVCICKSRVDSLEWWSASPAYLKSSGFSCWLFWLWTSFFADFSSSVPNFEGKMQRMVVLDAGFLLLFDTQIFT